MHSHDLNLRAQTNPRSARKHVRRADKNEFTKATDHSGPFDRILKRHGLQENIPARNCRAGEWD
jgi:hypothetical protein